MEIIGKYQLDGAAFEVFRSGEGFRFLMVEAQVVSVEMPYHEVVAALVNKQYQRVS